MPAIDWTSSSLQLAALVRVEYAVDGELKVARWCGPPEVTASGVVADVEGDGPHYYEPRLHDLEDDGDLGPLSNHVQALAELSLDVDVGPTIGPDGEASAAAELLQEAQTGRWENKSVRAWWATVDEDGNVSAAQPFFDGRTDRSATDVTDARFRLFALEDVVALDLPGTRLFTLTSW